MKRLCIFLLFLILFGNISIVSASEDIISNAKSGLLMEISTGKIIYEKNVDEKLAIASMTKMMSQILILETIESGKLSWDKIVKVSSNAAGFGGSQIYLQPGEEMSVEDIFKGISMASANDGTVALAEEIAGSEEEFVKMMNNKVKELGLKNTVFKNSTGLDEDGHYSSSYDMAIIARELLTKHPKILEYSSVYEDYLREDTANKFWLVNTNKLVRFYEGADGLKTGHTDNAGYCMAVTAKRGDTRYLAVVLGEETAAVRNQEVTNLLDYGFNNFNLNVLKKKGEVVDTKKIEKATNEEVNIILKDDITDLLKKNEEVKDYKYDVNVDDLSLPIKQGEVVGKMKVIVNDNIVKEGDLTVEKDINKLNIIMLYGKYLKNIVSGIL